MSKGSKPRPPQVPDKKVQDEWNRLFPKRADGSGQEPAKQTH